MSTVYDGPDYEIQRIHAVAVALTHRCPHCNADNHPALHEHGWVVEHHHEPGCPDHEDFNPPAMPTLDEKDR